MTTTPTSSREGLLSQAYVATTVGLFSLIAFRRRKAIAAWWRGRQSPEEVRRDSAESLSKAP